MLSSKVSRNPAGSQKSDWTKTQECVTIKSKKETVLFSCQANSGEWEPDGDGKTQWRFLIRLPRQPLAKISLNEVIK